MLEIKVMGKNSEGIFSGAYLNKDREIEFRSNNVEGLIGKTAIFKDNKLFLEEFNLYITIDKKSIEKIVAVRDALNKEYIELYRDIVSGEEPIILLESGLKDYPYIATTPRILDMGTYSHKHREAIVFAFSDDGLSREGISIRPGFKNSDEMQKGINYAAKMLKLKPNYIYDGVKVIKTTLRELLSVYQNFKVA